MFVRKHGAERSLPSRARMRDVPGQVDRRVAVRKPQQGREQRLLRHRHAGRDPDSPRRHPRPQGDLAHVDAQYASQPPNLKIVAEQLGVATVLEGSVQKAGEQVHINLQLIDARNDSHLWAQSYNRELKDIFAVEGEVAQSVADALKGAADAGRSRARDRGADAQRGRLPVVPAGQCAFQPGGRPGRAGSARAAAAITLYQRALDADPKFALAAAALGRAHMHVYFLRAGSYRSAAGSPAKTAIDRALGLQPDLGEGHYALALLLLLGTPRLRTRDRGTPSGAPEHCQQRRRATHARCDRTSPGTRGRHDRRLPGGNLLDPRSSSALDQLGPRLRALRRYAEADRAFAQAEEVTRDPADERVTSLAERRCCGRATWRADAFRARAPRTGSDAYAATRAGYFILYWWSHDFANALRIAQNNSDDAWSRHGQHRAATPALRRVGATGRPTMP
jgi:serine/threonine-protein kinase